MLVSPVQPENALGHILVTLSGMVMLVSPVQPENAEFPILVTLSGIVMLPLIFFGTYMIDEHVLLYIIPSIKQ